MVEFLITDKGKDLSRVPLCVVHPVDIKRGNTYTSYQQLKYGSKRGEERCIFQSCQWPTVEFKSSPAIINLRFFSLC